MSLVWEKHKFTSKKGLATTTAVIRSYLCNKMLKSFWNWSFAKMLQQTVFNRSNKRRKETIGGFCYFQTCHATGKCSFKELMLNDFWNFLSLKIFEKRDQRSNFRNVENLSVSTRHYVYLFFHFHDSLLVLFDHRLSCKYGLFIAQFSFL